jgi:hypothetical protein
MFEHCDGVSEDSFVHVIRGGVRSVESVQEFVFGAVVALTPCLVILAWLLLCSPGEEPVAGNGADRQTESADGVSHDPRFAG